MASYTYSDDPRSDGTAAQQRDAVRALANDTADGAMRASDAEIAFALREEANVYMAAARCVSAVIAKLGAAKRRKVGNLEVERDLEAFVGLRDNLLSRGRSHQVPFVGGLSPTERDNRAADDGITQPFFRRTMNDTEAVSMPPSRGDHGD